ncbi:MAG: hypothetical protein DRP94_01220 [Candidatus Latescibacterota bacterium]|nr:MAG: hypothetical protein DRP94_01220 [Candidatus Latescibacterota bacterium]
MPRRKGAVGICVEGRNLKLAYLRREGRGFVLEKLEEARLVKPLEGAEEEEKASPEKDENVFGLEEGPAEGIFEEIPTEGEEETTESVLLGLLSPVSLARSVLAFSLSEARVYYCEVEGISPKLKGKKLRRTLRDYISEKLQLEVSSEQVCPIFREDGRALVLAHEDPLPLLGLLDRIRPLLGKPPFIGLIDAWEVALMGMVRASYEFLPEEVTAILHVGDNYGRAIFLRGGDYLRFSPPIALGGLEPSQALQMLLSRILLEQDVSGVPELSRLLISGECVRMGALPFFRSQFPEAEVDYLVPAILRTEEEEEKAKLAAFAVPIALAWKALDLKNPMFFPTNLLPEHVRERQKVYKVAWHGLLLLSFVCASVLLLLWQAKLQNERIREAQKKLDRIEAAIFEAEKGLDAIGRIDSLKKMIQRYKDEETFMDTLGLGTSQWSSILERLARATHETGGIWFDELSPSGGKIALSGVASDRDRIPKLAKRLDGATVLQVTTEEVRGHPVYRFRMLLPISEPQGRQGS